MSQDCDIVATGVLHLVASVKGMGKRLMKRIRAGLLVGALLLTGCSASVGIDDGGPGAGAGAGAGEDAGAGAGAEAGVSTDSAVGETAAGDTTPTVPGYAVGDFPPIPLMRLPDLSMLDAALAGFAIEVKELVGQRPGIRVSPAHCADGGRLTNDLSSLMLYGDGSGYYTGPDGTVQNFGDGSGNYTINGTSVQVFGDGSGHYSDGEVTIQSFGDGSGHYSDGTVSIQLFGDGSGHYSGPDGSIQNFGDGSGHYSHGSVTIQNFGDGSGYYTDGTITIQNLGDGTGTINGVPRTGLPIVAPVPQVGDFPKMGTIAPITSCGTTITLEDGVLFDFGKSAIRPDAAQVLDTLAEALIDLDVAQGQVNGHTDAIGEDDFNQTLSEDRAEAVVAALSHRGVTATLVAEGFGETRPVAPNEIDGQDNPAGRQLNRRVEIFIPTSGAPE